MSIGEELEQFISEKLEEFVDMCLKSGLNDDRISKIADIMRYNAYHLENPSEQIGFKEFRRTRTQFVNQIKGEHN